MKIFLNKDLRLSTGMIWGVEWGERRTYKLNVMEILDFSCLSSPSSHELLESRNCLFALSIPQKRIKHTEQALIE